MSHGNTTDNKCLEAAAKRFESFKWEETHCANQDAFETFTAVVRSGLRMDLAEIIDELPDMSFTDVNAIISIIGFGAPREGSRVFASFTGGTEGKDPERQVSYTMLMEMAVAVGNPLSQEAAALGDQVKTMPELDWLLRSVEMTLNASLIRRFPALKKSEEAIGQLVLANILSGVRLEFLIPRLIAFENNQERLMSRLAKEVTARDEGEKEVIDRWRQSLGNREDARAWPKDALCVCGENLGDNLNCCKDSALLDTQDLANHAGANYLLKQPCCGVSLTGIRCRNCARYYTWARGVVDSYKQ